MPMLTLTSKTSLDTAKFKKILDINVMGSVYVSKYCAIEMAKQKGEGVIILVSSIAATEG
jgi:NAD(P)-dependent dehydrogenase (short-subunit alcohol dehydrogenase family)